MIRMNEEERKRYIEHCKRMSEKSSLGKIEKAFWGDPKYKTGDYGWLNGWCAIYVCAFDIHYFYPITAFLKLGPYEISIYRGKPDICIQKHVDITNTFGAKNRYFICGDPWELHTINANYIQLDPEEVIRLCKKDWKIFSNINLKNKYNILWIETFKQLVLKRLENYNIWKDETA